MNRFLTISLLCLSSVNSKSSSSSLSSSDDNHDDHIVFTVERFNEFKGNVSKLLFCDPTLEGDNPCQGLTKNHPDVSVYDRLGSDVDGPIVSSLVRLGFHDCGEVDPYYVSLGETSPFSDGSINGYVGGCNGCIGIDNIRNDNLLEGAIELLEPICIQFSDVISRADCWMLASTLAAEHSASAELNPLRGPPFFVTIDEAVSVGDIPYYYGRTECENDYASGVVEYPFSNPDGVIFELPDPTLGWTHMAQFFKSRFSWNNNLFDSSSSSSSDDGDDNDDSNDLDYFTNQDITGIISAAHSIGRAHERISGFSGPWDFTDEIMDNGFLSLLFSESKVASDTFGITQVWNQSIINKPQSGSLPQWAIEMPPPIIAQFQLDNPLVFDPPYLRLLLALNTDFSMVFDISYYIENGIELEIDCLSNAALLCDENEIVLTAPRGFENSLFNKGKTSEQLGEQTECGENESCCQYIQCPIQCEGGIDRYIELISDVDRLLSDDIQFIENELMNCPAALAKRYSAHNSRDVTIPNGNMGNDFVKAFTKIITLGYVDAQTGETLLHVVGES